MARKGLSSAPGQRDNWLRVTLPPASDGAIMRAILKEIWPVNNVATYIAMYIATYIAIYIGVKERMSLWLP